MLGNVVHGPGGLHRGGRQGGFSTPVWRSPDMLPGDAKASIASWKSESAQLIIARPPCTSRHGWQEQQRDGSVEAGSLLFLLIHSTPSSPIRPSRWTHLSRSVMHTQTQTPLLSHSPPAAAPPGHRPHRRQRLRWRWATCAARARRAAPRRPLPQPPPPSPPAGRTGRGTDSCWPGPCLP